MPHVCPPCSPLPGNPCTPTVPCLPHMPHLPPGPPPPHPHPHTHTPCPLPPLQYLFRGGDAFYGLRRDSSGRFVLVRYDYSGRVEVNYG
jgi:hypothetical protein